MKIKKTYHFYAAHRNETLQDKCFSLHGHLYRVALFFTALRNPSNPSITTLFSDFEPIEGYFKAVWDHAMLIHEKDPLLGTLHVGGFDESMKMVIMPRPTSVENVCYEMFRDIRKMGFHLLDEVQIQETESSTVIYTAQDFKEDEAYFGEQPKGPCECTFGPDDRCLVCGGTKWDYKVRKRNEKRAADQ